MDNVNKQHKLIRVIKKLQVVSKSFLKKWRKMELVIMGKENPKNLKNFTEEGRIVYVLQSVTLTFFSKRRGHFEINRGFSKTVKL